MYYKCRVDVLYTATLDYAKATPGTRTGDKILVAAHWVDDSKSIADLQALRHQASLSFPLEQLTLELAWIAVPEGGFAKS